MDLVNSASSSLSKAAGSIHGQSSPEGGFRFEGKNLIVDGKEFTPGKVLPGSTKPVLYNDDKGQGKWVVKGGGAEGQNVAENAASNVYNLLSPKLGTGASESHLVGGKLVNRFIEGGRIVNELSPKEIERGGIFSRLRKSFIADALLANWDFMGLSNDNVMLSKGGKLQRIDVGGTFHYRAQGGDKGYGAIPMEMWTLKTSNQGKQSWGNAKDSDFKDLWTRQASSLRDESKKIIDSVNKSTLPKGVKRSFAQRVWVLSQTNNLLNQGIIGGKSVTDLANSGKISWREIDSALKVAYTKAVNLNPSDPGWRKGVTRVLTSSLMSLF